MELKHHDAIVARGDSFVIDPRMLKVDVSYNVRNLSTADTLEHIAALKESIANNGVRVPLEVRLSGTDIFVVSGHCRHAAVMELIAEGRDDIKGVPCVREPKSVNDAERTLNLVISNSGKPLTTLEVAEVVRRLEAFGWTEAEIQKRMRWKSRATVTQHVEVAALPEDMKQHIRAGDISPTLARNLAKNSELTPEQQIEMLRANVEQNKKLGVGKKHKTQTKVTRKTLDRDKPKAKTQSDSAADTKPETEARPIPPMMGIVPVSNDFRSHMEAAHDPASIAAIPADVVSDNETLAALITLTREADNNVQHNKSDDNPGYYSTELVNAIDDAIAIIERLTGKPFERETIADPLSQEVVMEDVA